MSDLATEEKGLRAIPEPWHYNPLKSSQRLSLSPFIFRYPTEARFLWINDFVCAALIITFALASYWPPLDKVHLLQLGMAGWLIQNQQTTC